MPTLALVCCVFFFCFFFFVLVPSVMLAKSFSLPHKSPLCPLQRKTQPAILHSWRKGGEKPPSQSLKLALPSRSNWNLHNWGERAWKWARGLMAVVVLGRSGFFLSSGSVQTGVRRQGRPLLSALASPLALGQSYWWGEPFPEGWLSTVTREQKEAFSGPQVLVTFFAINETDTVISIWILGLSPKLITGWGGRM